MSANNLKEFFSVPKPRYGKKTRRAAQKWLSKRNLNLDDLTEEQQAVVLRLAKGRLAFYCTAPFVVITFILILVFGKTFFQVAYREITEVHPPYGYFVTDDGQEVFARLADRQIEFIKTRLWVCFIIGAVFGSAMVTALGVLGHIIGQMLLIKEFNKVFDAFLPKYPGAG